MTEIERCVCGSEADFLDPHLECPACGRAGWNVERWNHDQRGLRLLREHARLTHEIASRDEMTANVVVLAWDTDEQAAEKKERARLWYQSNRDIRAWAEEGERE